jgi:hypothetical protein
MRGLVPQHAIVELLAIVISDRKASPEIRGGATRLDWSTALACRFSAWIARDHRGLKVPMRFFEPGRAKNSARPNHLNIVVIAIHGAGHEISPAELHLDMVVFVGLF